MDKSNEYYYPHGPDVYERKTSDNGFSDGWGMHFKPVSNAWIDMHMHSALSVDDDISHFMTSYRRAKQDTKHLVVCTPPIISESSSSYASIRTPSISSKEVVKKYLSSKGEDFSFLLWLSHDNPDPEIIDIAYELGISGIKLHNAPMMTENVHYEIWNSPEWTEVFKRIEKYKLPVLWHVTQRLTSSPYTYGGENSYWKDGWKRGVNFTNQDLLDNFTEIVDKYKEINFIAAHQLHIGWPRVAELLDKHSNLYIDTTIGCQLRTEDDFYDHDRNFIRDYFIKYPDRFLFGTDTFIWPDISPEEIAEIQWNNNNHTRFINKLFLPDDVLQKVTCQNAEKLFNL